MARYDLRIDGTSRWKASSEQDLRAWLEEYRAEHAEDDPGAAHVQIRKLGPWAWLTGGSMVSAARSLQD